MKFLALLVTLFLLAFTAVACGGEEEGGGSGEEGGGTAEESDGAAEQDPAQEDASQEFTVDATEICAEANQQLNEVRDFAQEGPPIIEDALSRLEDLTPPPEDQQTFNQFVDEGEDALRTLENSRQEPQGDPFARFTRLGQQLGIEGGCTRAGQSPEDQPPTENQPPE